MKLDVGKQMKLDMDCEGKTHEAVNDVVALEPGKLVELGWVVTSERSTRVVFTFEEAGRGATRVRMVQSGFGDGADWDEWYARAAVVDEKIAARPAKVWEAIGSAEGLGRWFSGKGGSLDARAGGRVA